MKTKPIVCLVLCLAVLAMAVTRSVSTNAEAQTQIALLQAGDTLLFQPGDYLSMGQLRVPVSGTPTQRVFVRAAAPNTVRITFYGDQLFWIDKKYITFENLTLDGVNGTMSHFFKFFDGGQHIHIRNCKMLGSGDSPFKAGSMNTTPDSIFPGDYTIVEGCDISSNQLGKDGNGNGFNFNGPEYMVIRNNWIHHLVRTQGSTVGTPCYIGFFKAAAQHNIVENNIFGPGTLMRGFCFGGGCTGASYMRQARTFETNDICYRNNVLIGISEVQYTCGTNTNRKVYHNTIINSAGTLNADDIRNNLILGGTVSVTGGSNNYTGAYDAAYFWEPTTGARNYALKSTATALIAQVPRIDSALTDAAGTARPATVSYGAYEAYAMNPIGLEAVSGSMPEVLVLDIAPNPANPTATVRFCLAQSMKYIEVGIYDLSGRTVRLLFDGSVAAGNHTLTWDGKGHTSAGIASGVYLVRLRVDARQCVKRFVYVR